MYPWIVKHKALVCALVIGLHTALAFPIRKQSPLQPHTNVFDITSELTDAEVELSLTELGVDDLVALNKLIDDASRRQTIAMESPQKPAEHCGKQEADSTHLISKNSIWQKRSSGSSILDNDEDKKKDKDIKYCASLPPEPKDDKNTSNNDFSCAAPTDEESKLKDMKRQLSYLETREKERFKHLKEKLKHMEARIRRQQSQNAKGKQKIKRSSL